MHVQYVTNFVLHYSEVCICLKYKNICKYDCGHMSKLLRNRPAKIDEILQVIPVDDIAEQLEKLIIVWFVVRLYESSFLR